MSKNREIYQRLEDLHNVLAYCSEQRREGKIYAFKTSERICINQERGALLSQINRDNLPYEKRYFQIPASVEAKVKLILEKIDFLSWRSFNQNIFVAPDF